MTAAKGSPSGRAGAQAPERARLLTETPKHSDNTALSKALLIAVQQLFGNGLALSVTFGDTSPKGRGFGRPGHSELDAGGPIWRKSAGLAYGASGFWTTHLVKLP